VTDDEFGHEIVHRAQRAGAQPQQYYDQIVRAGTAGVIYGDVRRGKTLAALMDRVVIEDTNGQRLSVADLRDDADEHEHGDDEGHDD
jgi:trigger factor